MSDYTVFYWEPLPHQRVITPMHRTIISTYESGWEQRRPRWSAGKLQFQYGYDRTSTQGWEDMLAFFEARRGAYDWFRVPAWIYGAELLNNTSNSQTRVIVNNRDIFSPTAGVRGNWIFMSNSWDRSVGDARSIDRFGATAGWMWLHYAPDTTIRAGQSIFPAVACRFEEDQYTLSFRSRTIGSCEVRFVEVRET